MDLEGATVAQWVKRWPTDPVGPSSSPAGGEIFSTIHWKKLLVKQFVFKNMCFEDKMSKY